MENKVNNVLAPTHMEMTDQIYMRQLIKEIEDAKNSCSHAMKNTLSTLIQSLEISMNTSTMNSDSKSKSDSDDTFAVLYIVFVLMFFAASLVVVLIKYLMRERESVRLEAFYNNYLQKKPPRTVLYDQQGRRLKDPEIWCEVTDHDCERGGQRRKVEFDSLSIINSIEEEKNDSNYPDISKPLNQGDVLVETVNDSCH